MSESLTPKLVLLVEDDLQHAELILRSFEGRGGQAVTVEHVVTFADADARLRERGATYDLVITDVGLPDGDGVDIVRELAREGMPCPVIVMTSQGDGDAALVALEHGALDYVIKSDALFADMPHIVERSLREWSLLCGQRAAHDREKELERRVAHTERFESLGTLAGGVAHDLNNILSPMLALPDLIKLDLDAVLSGDREACDRVKADIDGFKVAAGRAASVVSDLMTLSHRHACPSVPVSLNEVIEQVVAGGEHAMKAEASPRISLKTDLAESLPAIDVGAEHLMRVISNLMRNACDASFPGSEVWLRSRLVCVDGGSSGYEPIEAGEYVCLMVEDEGKGMTAADLPKIFEPFYTRKIQSSVSGTGLGLSVVHGLVKDYDGYLDVSSEPGKGSTFSIYFPPSTRVLSADGHGRIPGGSERILVVDDDDEQCRAFQRVLADLGYGVNVVANGEEALKVCLADEAGYDLLLIDMVLGRGWDGLETLGQIIRAQPSQKAIIVSGFAVEQHELEAKHLGVPWLAKPYKVGELAVLIRSVLDERSGDA